MVQVSVLFVLNYAGKWLKLKRKTSALLFRSSSGKQSISKGRNINEREDALQFQFLLWLLEFTHISTWNLVEAWLHIYALLNWITHSANETSWWYHPHELNRKDRKVQNAPPKTNPSRVAMLWDTRDIILCWGNFAVGGKNMSLWFCPTGLSCTNCTWSSERHENFSP